MFKVYFATLDNEKLSIMQDSEENIYTSNVIGTTVSEVLKSQYYVFKAFPFTNVY